MVCEATLIAEEVTSDFFRLTESEWARHPFEVATLREVRGGEHPGRALAHLVYYEKDPRARRRARDLGRLWRICLNDPRILERSQGSARLFPLLTYIMTHELVHIARFSRYQYSPLLGRRDEEEARVHRITGEILSGVRIPGMGRVLDSFGPARRACT